MMNTPGMVLKASKSIDLLGLFFYSIFISNNKWKHVFTFYQLQINRLGE